MPDVGMKYAHLRKKCSPYRLDILDVGGFNESQEFIGLRTWVRIFQHGSSARHLQ